MKKSIFTLVSLGLLILFTAPSQAGNTFTYPPLNPALSITFPDNWSVKPDPDATAGIIAESPDQEIEIDLWALDKKDVQQNPEKALDDAAREVASLIVRWVDDFQAGKAERFTVNGIEFCEVKGTAKDTEDGSPVKVAVDFFSPDNKTVFVMLYWGSADAETKYLNDLSNIAKSIKKP